VSDLLVRPATVDDLAAAAAIYNEGIEDRLATFETRPRSAGDARGWLDDGLPS
jgi:L-amino acid N-acyltransferase YncA